MAIESNRIVVTTAKHSKVAGSSVPTPACIDITPSVPPNGYTDGTNFITQPAEYEGQIRAVETTADGLYTLYCVVKTLSPAGEVNLTWKKCSIYTILINPGTGEPYDPLSSFYGMSAN